MPSPQSLWAAAGALHIQAWPSQSRRPILMVHGMAGNVHWWDWVAPFLSGNFQPAALDLSGHGESAWRQDGDYSAAHFVEDIEQARLALGWDKFFLCGHSFGARMSLDYALKRPERLLGIVCADFMPQYRRPNPTRKSFLARLKPRQPYYPSRKQILERFHLQPRPHCADESRLRVLAESCIRQTERGYTWRTDWRIFTFRYESAWPIFPKLDMPCLIIRGEHSSIMEREDFVAVVKAVSGAKGFEIPGSFHHVTVDKPQEFAAAVSNFTLGLEKGIGV